LAAVLADSDPRPAFAWRAWLPVIVGLLLVYVPTFYGLLGYWQEDEGAHGPIILAVVVWMFWRRRDALFDVAGRALPGSGLTLLVVGLLFYVVGRSQEIAFFEVLSLLPVLAGILLAMRGWMALRALWFPIMFVMFMLPLPGILIDTVTGPLKQLVSAVAEVTLHAAGYPIARDGVMLTIGQYQLLVADACSGLHSMFSLSALGLLYIYLTRRTNFVHNAIMLASLLPIAFVANALRVLLLMLITFHFGDAAGQGFLHGAAGILLFVAALGMLLALDAALSRTVGQHATS
jgi:exosortase B